MLTSERKEATKEGRAGGQEEKLCKGGPTLVQTFPIACSLTWPQILMNLAIPKSHNGPIVSVGGPLF